MKIDYLTLKNIGPFAGTSCIDFTSLGDIFLICGKTGSGKSTIFDAVTYALYGKMPGAKKTVDTIRLRSDFCSDDEESAVTLDFSVADRAYRAHRTLPVKYITRNGTERQKDSEILIYQKSSSAQDAKLTLISDKTSEANKYIESLIALSVEEFARIVLLPQGEFAEFLKQNSNDRRASLAKLFPVELYTAIIEKAKVQAAEYKTRLDSAQQAVDMLEKESDTSTKLSEGETTETILAQLENEKSQAVQKREQTSEHILAAARRKDALQSSIDDTQRLESLYGLQKTLNEQEPHIASLTDKLTLAEKAASVQKYIDDDVRCTHDYEQSILQKKTADSRHTAAKEKSAALKNKASEIEEKKQHISRIELCVHDLESASITQKKLTDVRKSLAESKHKELVLSEKIAALRTQHDELCAFLSTSHFSSAVINDLIEAERKSADESRAADDMLYSARSRKTYQDKITAEKKKFTDLTQQIDTAEKDLLSVRSTIEKKEQDLVTVRALQSAPQLALLLRDSEPCPVCGSTHHPHPAEQAQDTAALQAEIETLKRIASAAEKNIPHLHAERTSAENAVVHHQEITADIDKKYPALPSSEQALDNLNSAKEAHKKIQDALKAAQTQAAEHEKKTKDRDAFAEQLRPLADEKATLAARISALGAEEETYRADLANVTSKHQHVLAPYMTGAFDAQLLFTSLSTVLQDTRKTVAAYTQECERAESELAASAQQSLTASQRVEETRRIKEKAHEQAALHAQNNGFSSIDDARCAALSPEEKQRLTADLESHRKQKTETLARISETEKRLQNSLPPEIARIPADAPLQTAGFDTTSLKAQLNLQMHKCEAAAAESSKTAAELQKHIDTISSRIQAIISRRDALAKARAVRDQISRDAQKYMRLYAVLSGKNPRQTVFDSWVLGMYLEEVTVFASRRLERISEGRYTLHLNEGVSGGRDKYKGLDLEIFDSYTGRRRPCSTLSGGETFMTSISLALALSDVVQSYAGGVQLDSLFIDEGFGSLDEATLEKAMSILDEIRGTRCVGLISHVGDLKSRIPSRIEIEKSRRGSTVTVHT